MTLCLFLDMFAAFAFTVITHRHVQKQQTPFLTPLFLFR
jgi:hypothetical protein